MTKGNVIDLSTYREEYKTSDHQPPAISKELEHAIEDLIQQLRDTGPIKQPSGR